MPNAQSDSLTRLEGDLWAAADQLRANSKLTSSEYCMPVLGVIFLRHAANRFEAATRQIQADQAAGRMPKRSASRADYVRRRALWLPEKARYDAILALPKETDLGEGRKKVRDPFPAFSGLDCAGPRSTMRPAVSALR